MKKIIYILIAFILTNCTFESKSDLSSDILIKKTFNKSEIKDLQKIFDFFNNEICSSNEKKLNECYESYCLEIKSQIEKEFGFNANLDYEKQLKLFSEIQENTFKEIWSFEKSLPINERIDTLKYLGFNYQGKYRKFLNEYGRENNAVKHYVRSYNISADLGPSMIAELSMNYESFRINELKTKLVIAIHYLTLNDQNWRNEKY
jgi:hypothetical protein